jgi:hypothetical protein
VGEGWGRGETNSWAFNGASGDQVISVLTMFDPR